MTEPQPSSIDAGNTAVTAKPKPAGAGLGGVGAGTGLVAIAQAVGPSSTLGIVLLWIAPTVSFVTGAAFYYVQVQASRYFEKRLIGNARKTLEKQLDNPKTSDEHKAKIRDMLEDLEETVANAELERVRLIGMPQRLTEAGAGQSAETAPGVTSRQPRPRSG